MRWLITLLALAGIVAASLALREHYNTGASPCAINEKWDCGTVNKGPYAVVGGISDLLTKHNSIDPDEKRSLPWLRGIPVAIVGIMGYLVLGGLALMKKWRLLAALAGLAFLFSCYLAYIEWRVIEVWCIYCVTSWGIITLIALFSSVAAVIDLKKAHSGTDPVRS